MQDQSLETEEVPTQANRTDSSTLKWTTLLKHPVSVGIIVLLASALFFSPTDNRRWDPSFYYAQVRAPIVDGHLNFRGETDTGIYETAYTVTGLQNSAWPVGPSLLWAPFLIAAHIAVSIVAPAQATGFSFPYIVLVSAGSSLYGLVGLGLLFLLARRFSSSFLSLLAVFMALAATPLAFYIFRQPLMAHTTSLAAGAALVLAYLAFEEDQLPRRLSGLWLGVLLGLNILTRWSGFLAGIFPLAFFAAWAFQVYQGRRREALKAVFIQVGVFCLAVLLAVTPQLALWLRIHNRLLVSPQNASAFVGGLFPTNLANIFIHTNRGILFWAPFVLVALIGLFWIENRKYRYLSISFMAANLILIGYRMDWFSGGGFGARYFIEGLPVLVIGFVSLAKKLPQTTGVRAALTGFALLLALHQAALVFVVENSPTLAWIDHGRYLAGDPLGARFHLTSIYRLLTQPALWLSPHPYVAVERQALVVNMLEGVRDPRAYRIPGLGAAFLALFAGLASWAAVKLKVRWLTSLFVGLLVYLVGWAVFYLMVGR